MKLFALRARARDRKALGPGRKRTLLWALLVAGLCGVIEFGMPAERVLRTGREMLRLHPSDGKIVVVKVDNESIAADADWSARRETSARALDILVAAGARRVFFDKVYADPSPVGDDDVFADALRRHKGRAFLATRIETDRVSGAVSNLYPTPKLRRVASVGSIDFRSDVLGYTSGVPFVMGKGDQRHPSFSSLLAEVPVDKLPSAKTFTPDYAIDVGSIPSLSLVEVTRRSGSLSTVSGKDVLIGSTEESLGDIHRVPGHGRVPGVFVHAVAAETLRRGMPESIGWLAPFLVAVAIAIGYLGLWSRARHALIVVAVATFGFAPSLLDARNIDVQVVPSILLIGIVVYRDRLRKRIISNPLTGLPTLDYGARLGGATSLALVGLKIANYADLRAMLDIDEERAMLREVVRRLNVSGGVIDLIQGDDGFVWKTEAAVDQNLFDHVEGLRSLLLTPINVGKRMVDLSVTLGIDADTARPLNNRIGSVLLAADQAAAAGHKWKLHDPEELADADFRLSLMSSVDSAIENGELWVAYQPKLDLRRKRICGAEALVRWTHPTRGFIPPDKFIPAAEAANRIGNITYFVLDTALRDLAALDAVEPEMSVAVNLSARMLNDADLVTRVAMALDSHGIDPKRLTLELTESVELDPAGKAVGVLGRLRDLGLTISIDDYGTKYSTLDYVRQLPASEIKIDQSFIRNLADDERARHMANSTIELAHSLGLTVVAEGVEYPETLCALQDMGCDVIQGWIIGKPLSFENLKRFVSIKKRLKAA